MRRSPASVSTLLASALALSATVALAAPAVAAPAVPTAGPPQVLAEHLVTPLSVAASADGTLHVTESFAGQLTRIDAKGARTTVASGPEVAGVSVSGDTVTWGVRAGDQGGATSSTLETRTGSASSSVDILAYEQASNPDGGVAYGFESISDECAAQLPPFIEPDYTGHVDSHVYGTAIAKDATYVADAGANAVLKVQGGTVSTVAVLPAQPILITPELRATAAQNPDGPIDLPACLDGLTYRAEAVPTDVAVGQDGALYVSTLPGSPGTGGPYGSIYRVDPTSGAATLLASGLAGPTGLAIAPNGTLFVAQLFGGVISSVSRDGQVSVFAQVDSPADVTYQSGKLVATTDVFADGRVVSYRIR